MAFKLKPKSRSLDAAPPTNLNLVDGEIAVNSFSRKIYQRVGTNIIAVANYFSGAWSDLTGKPTTLVGYGITDAQEKDGTLTAIAGLATEANRIPLFTGADTAAMLVWSTDDTLAGNSDTTISSQKAIKTYIDSRVVASDAMVYKTVIDCSTNPNYPAANNGWTYRVSVAGKIGGAAGVNVEVGDVLICGANSVPAGDHATVGAQWTVIQANIDGALTSASIGSSVQAYDAGLTSFAGLTTAANKGFYATGVDAFATYDLSAAGRALANTLGTANTFPYFSAANVVSLQSITAQGRALLDDADEAAQRTTLGLGTAATSAVGDFAAATHTHTYADLTGVVPTWNQNTTGNAATATALASARTLTIGGVARNFDGTANLSWTLAEIGAAVLGHGHAIADVTGLQGALDSKASATHNHALNSLSNVTITNNSAGSLLRWDGASWANSTLAAAGIAAAVHTHAIGDVTGLQVALDGKLATTGTAAAATKIATARTINGVAFDGTANITISAVTDWTEVTNKPTSFATSGMTLAAGDVPTLNQNTTGSAATLTTPRTLTIGSSGKAFNGSVNVAWTLAEIGAAATAHTHAIADVTGLQDELDGVLTQLDNKALSTLSDVTISGISTGSLLRWNGTVWANSMLAAADLNSAFGSQSAAFVYAAPAGSAGNPSFRPLVAADIPALSYQQADGDLTSLASATGTNTIYYRSAADAWSPVIIGTNLTFSGGTLSAIAGGISDGDKGDMTVSGGGTVFTIDADAVGNAKLANMPATTIKGNSAGTAGDPEDLTPAQIRTLINVANGATANSSDAFLLNRSNQTGTQLASTISDFSNAVSSEVQNLLVQGPGISLTYDNVLNTITISGTGGGGGGAPGGTTGEVQYNNGGSFAGAADVEIEGGQLRLNVLSAAPAAPAAGGFKLYGKSRAGLDSPTLMLANGLEVPMQASIAINPIAFAQAIIGGGTPSQIGIVLTATGSATAATWAGTNLQTRAQRSEYLVTTAATNAVAGWRHATARWTIGSSANDGSGGFYFHHTFGPATGVATQTHRGFWGFRENTAAPTDGEPSSFTNIVGVGWDAADTNIQIMHRGAGAVTKIDLGASFPVPTADRTKWYRLELYSPTGTTQSVSYRFEDLATGAVATGTITTNLPAATTALAPRGWMSVGGTSSVIGVAFGTLLIQSNF